MTLINAWSAPRGAGGSGELRVAVQCDGCLPPRVTFGASAARMSEAGWAFDDVEAGPHLCPWCARKPVPAEPRRRAPAQRRPALPNLLIIGAGKSGTTSLHRYLDEHPQVFMSEPKELRFFVDPACFERLDLYATFFDGDAAVRGESSPAYTAYPLVSGVPDRIRAAVPEARLIYLVRDPIERIVSAYVERHTHARSMTPLPEAVGDLADPHNPYLAHSRYATQLEGYLRAFPREQIMVVDHADLLARRRDTLRDVFRFLAVDDAFWSPAYERRRNPRERKVQWSDTARRLADSRLARAMRRVVPERPRRALFAPAKRLTTTKLESPVLDDGLRHSLREALRDEAERLRALTDQPFSSWQV